MITIETHLKITKEWNEITLKYARKVVVRDLLERIFFTPFDLDFYSIKPYFEEFKEMHVEGTTFRDIDFYFEFQNDIKTELAKLDKSDLFALYILELNLSYNERLEELLDHGGHTTEWFEYDENSEVKFGRELAYKLYDPIIGGLHKELEERMVLLICNIVNEYNPINHPNEDIMVVEREEIQRLLNYYFGVNKTMVFNT